MSEFITSFQKDKNLEQRQQMALAIRKKYPDRLAVIMDRVGFLDPQIIKHKFLVPSHLTLGQFNYVVRKRLKLEAPKNPISEYQTIYINIHGTKILPPMSELMYNIAAQHGHQDGFLYLNYGLEHSFGG